MFEFQQIYQESLGLIEKSEPLLARSLRGGLCGRFGEEDVGVVAEGLSQPASKLVDLIEQILGVLIVGIVLSETYRAVGSLIDVDVKHMLYKACYRSRRLTARSGRCLRKFIFNLPFRFFRTLRPRHRTLLLSLQTTHQLGCCVPVRRHNHRLPRGALLRLGRGQPA